MSIQAGAARWPVRMNWERPLPDFQFILFERVNPSKNESRFYYLGWQQTLLHPKAVMRLFERKGDSQRLITPQPFEFLEAAWPLIREIIKTRLRHGYQVVQPADYRN